MSNTNQAAVIKNTHRKKAELDDFQFSKDQVIQPEDLHLQAYHSAAWEMYEKLPFPTREDEPWRRTDIRGLNTAMFRLRENGFRSEPPERLLDPVITGEKPSGQMISGAVETYYHLDDALVQQGVIFMGFHQAETTYPELVGQLVGQIVASDENKFTAQAAALGEDGVFLYVPKNVVIEHPLHSLYWGAGEHIAFINHLLLWVEDGAEVTFVHESSSASVDIDVQNFHNGIVEIYVGRNARLTFVELQSWGKNVWSITRERAKVMGDGTLEWIFGAMGTHLTKNFSDIDLAEPGAMGRMSGFYFASGNQHLDHDTQQNHLAKETTSDLLYKGALLDNSRSVWQGMIYVAPGAIGTDGYQTNRNLILSKKARADSIPGLEILADDVRCSHGATVGKIDENELFYLLSRGIPQNEAEQLIVMGFFAPIMSRIPFEGVQNRFKDAISEKMAERLHDNIL